MKNPESQIRDFLIEIVTKEFLEEIERWSRYEGETLSAGDADVIVQNLGTVRRKESVEQAKLLNEAIESALAKLSPNKKRIKSKLKRHTDVFDLTLIRDTCTTSPNDAFVLVSKRQSKYLEDKPRDLWIYPVDLYGKSRGKYVHKPTIARLKSDLKSGQYQAYYSLINNFCGTYSLSLLADNTSQISAFQVLYSDLCVLEADEDTQGERNKIKVAKRKPNRSFYKEARRKRQVK